MRIERKAMRWWVYNMDVSRVDFFRSTPWLDEQAFEALFLEHYTMVYNILFRLTGDRYEADDLAAEAFWRLWERPPARLQNAAGWLYRVATRLGYNALRDNRRRELYETASTASLAVDPDGWTAANQSDPAHTVEQRQERYRVRAVLRQMALRDVQALVLHHSDFSYKEIAAALDVPASSVGTLLSRAEIKFEALYRRGEKDASER